MFRLLQLPLTWWNNFFHTRTSSSVFVLCGRLRIFYAILLLCDRYILSYDFDFFFLSGIMPCDQHVTSSSPIPSSLLCRIVGALSPDYSHYVYYTFFYVGIVNAVLLLLGIAPKFQLLLLHVNMLSFHFHSSLIWDGEDNMFKIWNFLFMFLPLHHVTIYDNFRHLFYYKGTSPNISTSTGTDDDTKLDADSWPMWPFRLWQIEICCIYIGAGYTKLSTDQWNSGNALYSIIHTKDFFGGPFVPDFIFNRRGPLHIMTWSSLVVECGSIIFIWPKRTRLVTLVSIILLHLGIEGAMNMHCFEWLSILGWLFFLVERKQCDTLGTLETNHTKEKIWIPMLLNTFLLLVTTSFLFDTIPFSHFAEMLPNMGYATDLIGKTLLTLEDYRVEVALPQYYEPYLFPLGLHQGIWDLFTGTNDHNYRFETIVTFENGTSTEVWSPDWGTLTWYEKKRWQRPMTFYENFPERGCKNCYATFFAEPYGSNVASVSIVSHCEYPILEPPGNLFDMEYFFKPAKETLVRSEPEELFVLNYCDDAWDECDEYSKRGLCKSRNDETLSGMVVNCRYSCQLCHYDAETLQVGARISVYMADYGEYVDGTVLGVKLIQHIRRYLIEYDNYYETPKWTSSMVLRQQGVLILTADDFWNSRIADEEGSEESVGTLEDETERDGTRASSSAAVEVDESDDDVDDDEDIDDNNVVDDEDDEANEMLGHEEL